MTKFLDSTGLTYLWSKIKTLVTGYTVITEANNVKTLTVGNTSTTLVNKTSQLQNDSGYITLNEVPEGVSASTVTPNMDGTASIGTDDAYARGDHRHPSDTSKIDITLIGAANGVCPLDQNTKIDAQYLPSYVDDVIEAYIRSGLTALSSTWLATESSSGTVITPEIGKIYVLMNSDNTYSVNTEFRWAGSTYVKINDGGISELTIEEMDVATNNWA